MKFRNLRLESLEERELLAVTAGWMPTPACLAAPMMTGDAAPEIDVMNLSSKPDAVYTIYLDFDGHVMTDTEWNRDFELDRIVIPRFALDGDTEKESFSAEEEAAIYKIWQIVSEDFIPFDVNVTTVEPSGGAFNDKLAQRVVLGGNSEWTGMNIGGYSYVGSFFQKNTSFNNDSPCFVFTDNCSSISNMGNTASHEAGHTIGLSGHKGNSQVGGDEEYFHGIDGWAPIMGGGERELFQWSKGEYSGATNRTDELKVIASHLGYRADDYAESFEDAAVLSITDSVGEISGIIERNTDVDAFVFESNGSNFGFRIGGLTGITNLDVLVKIYTEDRELLGVYDPADRLDVEFVFSQRAGTYYLTVEGTGLETDWPGIYSDYGSLGAYTVVVSAREYAQDDPESLVVTTLDDVVAADGFISLREAISYAAAGGTVTFDAALAGGAITLNGAQLEIFGGIVVDASAIGGITIDAGGKSRVFYVRGGNAEYPAELIGLTVTGGSTFDYGAGIFNDGVLTLVDCVVSGNTSVANRWGSGICNYGGLTLTDCAVTGNTAKYGGGIINGDARSSATLNRCVVSGNTAEYGGGIYNHSGTLTLTDSAYSENTAKYGGGIFNDGADSTAALTGCTVSGNTAKSGGGVLNNSGTLILNDCAVTGNSTDTYGGGIYNDGADSSAALTGCTVSGNTAGNGSGISNNSGTMTLTGCTVSENTASRVGGIFNNSGTLTLTACTISGNTAQAGGGLYNQNGTATLTNTVVSGNSVPNYGGGIYNNKSSAAMSLINCTVSGNTADGGSGIRNNNEAALTLTNTIVALNYSPAGTEIDGEYSGVRNIVDADPGFVAAPVFEDGVLINADALDLSLAAGSAAIDAGTNDVVDTETDLVGYPRIVGGVVDIGAYEYQSGGGQTEQLSAPKISTGTGGNYVSFGANRHRIEWNTVENASGYELSYSADGGNTWISVETAETAVVVGGLTYGADVTYRVRALGTGPFENSEWSAAASFTVCPMDINGDGDISGSDRTILAGAWLAEAGDEAYRPYADVNGDGDISGADRAYISGNWLAEAGDDGLNYPRAAAADVALAEYAPGELDADRDVF